MEGLQEKVAYLKGLCEGMGIAADKGEGKLITKIIEVLDDMAEEISCIADDQEELQAQVDEIDEDLSTVEDYLYDDDDDYCDDFDCEDIVCPNCGAVIHHVDFSILEQEINCEACGLDLYFLRQNNWLAIQFKAPAGA